MNATNNRSKHMSLGGVTPSNIEKQSASRSDEDDDTPSCYLGQSRMLEELKNDEAENNRLATTMMNEEENSSFFTSTRTPNNMLNNDAAQQQQINVTISESRRQSSALNNHILMNGATGATESNCDKQQQSNKQVVSTGAPAASPHLLNAFRTANNTSGLQ